MALDKKKTTAVTDPLEASKIPTKPEVLPMPDPPAPPLAVPAPAQDAVPPPPPVKRFRVATDTSISLNGQIVRLNAGDIVSESSYGPDGMRRILESNVALVEV